ncbi:hypothetical protein [Haladaptatus sp. CMSO5]|uniref:hypothetical protein n=1 Tax=Haladaptatus sp. CMSO5 TaxID=3120514 RepID=UPI002FCE63A4
MHLKTQRTVSKGLALFVATVVAWGIANDIAPTVLGLLCGYAFVFAGGSVRVVYDTVPNYMELGFVVMGVAGGAVLLAGVSPDLAKFAVVVGVGNALSLLWGRRTPEATGSE